MKPVHDHLVARLESVLARLDAGDAEAVAAAMDETVALFEKADRPWADPRVLPLFKACQARATNLLEGLQRELSRNARSRRAATAYGDLP